MVERRLNYQLHRSDIYVHDLDLILGITNEQVLPLIRETIESDTLPVVGALESLECLARRHDIVLVTARPPNLLEVTRDWLERHAVPHFELAYLDEVQKHASDHEFDVVVDDHIREVLGFVGKVKHLVVFDHEWNQTLNLGQHVTRVRSWPEIEVVISAVADE